MVVGIVAGHPENLVVGLATIEHLEHPERPAVDLTSRKGRLVDVDEDVERVAILVQCARNEAVIARIVHRRIQHPVESNHPTRLIQLVFVAASGRNLDDRGDVVRRMDPRRQLVPEIDHAVTRCIVPLYPIGSSSTPKLCAASSATRSSSLLERSSWSDAVANSSSCWRS